MILADRIERAISGEGPENASGPVEIFRETVNGSEVVGVVDVSWRPDDCGNDEYVVNSVANDMNGEAICEPENDFIWATTTRLADFLMRLVNVSFRKSELLRLVSDSEE